jgi:hypothetical protein
VEEHWKELERFVGYLKVNEQNIKITYRTKGTSSNGHVDSNYATNTDDRRSTADDLHCRWNDPQILSDTKDFSDIMGYRSRM